MSDAEDFFDNISEGMESPARYNIKFVDERNSANGASQERSEDVQRAGTSGTQDNLEKLGNIPNVRWF